MQVLASFIGSVTFTDLVKKCSFTGAIDVTQKRGDTDPATYPGVVSGDLDVTFNRDLYDAVTARVRWTASDLFFDGDEIVLGRGVAVSVEEGFPAAGETNGPQTTMKFQPVGDLWAIPSTDFTPPDASTCPVSNPVHARKSPRMIGNKHTTLDVILGNSPSRGMYRRLFQGMSFQKSNRGNVAVTGEITCIDDSSLYVNKPLCYEIAPFSGLRRDEIVRGMAAAVGLNPSEPGTVAFGQENSGGQVRCPIGAVYTKPLLITNGSFMAVLNDFIAPENWYASFDEFGILNVRPIELKNAPDLPDWILDASLGDFDYDTFEEEPPSAPPSKIVVTVSKPVAGTGPDGSDLTQTTRTTVEEQDLYAPRCVKVRPSGLASHLFGDGSYRTLAQEELMTVARTVTDVTTLNGQEVKRVTTKYGMFNPAAYDANFNVYPNTAFYDGAYGDKSFHRDECETLMLTSEDVLATNRDIFGTILGTVETSKGWYAPHRGLTFYSTSRHLLLNDLLATPPSYVYAGGTSRILPNEVYGLTLKTEKTYTYGSDGALLNTDEIRSEYTSPLARCDIVVPDNPDIPPTPSNPPIDNPPPSPPPSQNPDWYPQLTGPVQDDGHGTFTFLCSIEGGGVAPNPGPLTTGVVLQAFLTTGFIPTHGGVGQVYKQSTGGQGVTLVPPPNVPAVTSGYAKVTFSGPKPTGTVFVTFDVNRSGDAHGSSNTIIFDPWQNVPPGGSL